jgi:hypothetical protein
MPQTSNSAADAAGLERLRLCIAGLKQPSASRDETTRAVAKQSCADQRPVASLIAEGAAASGAAPNSKRSSAERRVGGPRRRVAVSRMDVLGIGQTERMNATDRRAANEEAVRQFFAAWDPAWRWVLVLGLRELRRDPIRLGRLASTEANGREGWQRMPTHTACCLVVSQLRQSTRLCSTARIFSHF